MAKQNKPLVACNNVHNIPLTLERNSVGIRASKSLRPITKYSPESNKQDWHFHSGEDSWRIRQTGHWHNLKFEIIISRLIQQR